MDHRAFVAGLSPETKRDLQHRDNFKGLMHLGVHVASIVLLAVLVMQGGVPRYIAVLPLGITLIFLFTLEHEATHQTPFASPWLNEWVGTAIGILILLPFTWFRYFHLAHHKYTNDPDRDPELLAGGKPQTRWDYIKHVSGLPVWYGQLRKIIANASGRPLAEYIPKNAHSRIRAEARLALVLYSLALISLLFSDFIFWVWIVPLLLGQPFLRLYLLAEHGRCAFVDNMLENTRTTYTNRFIRLLAWNMPFHAEHHTMPNVPFHALPRLNTEMAQHLKSTTDGYSTFHKDYIATLKTSPNA